MPRDRSKARRLGRVPVIVMAYIVMAQALRLGGICRVPVIVMAYIVIAKARRLGGICRVPGRLWSPCHFTYNQLRPSLLKIRFFPQS